MSLTAAELRAVYSVDEGPLDRSLAALPGKVDGATSRLGAVGSAIGAGIARGAAVLGAGVAAAGVVGIKTAAQLEQANIGFTTMLGSGEKAQAFLGKLSAFAAKTPFEFPELQTAASSLVSAGVEADKVIPIMTSLGNATSGMGTGSEGVKRATVALQQMNAAGKITAEDLNQLRDAGIPVYDLLAAATGKSKEAVADLAAKGKLGREELGQLMSALESGKGLERFTGLMEAQSQSLNGMWSTLKDTFSMGMATAIQPLIPMIKDGLGGATSFVAEMMPKVASGLATVASWAQVAYGILFQGDYKGGLVAGLSEDSKAVDVLFRIREAALSVFDAFRSGDLSSLGDSFGSAASTGGSLVSMLGSLTGMLPDVATLVGAAADGIGFLADHADKLAYIVPVLAAAFVAYKAAQAVGNVAALASIPIQAAQVASNFALAAALRSAGAASTTSAVQQVASSGAVQASTLRTTVAALSSSAAVVGGWIAMGASAVWNAAKVVAGWVLMGTQSLLQGARMAAAWVLAMGPVGWVIAAVIGLVALIVANWDTVVSWTKTAWDAVVGAVSAAWEWIKGAVKTGIDFLVNLFLNFTGPGLIIKHWETIKNFTVNAWNAITGAVSGAWNAVTGAISNGIGTAVNFVRELPGKILSALGNLGSLLLDAGGDIIRGFINGIKGMFGSVKDTLSNLTSKLTSWKGPPSTDRVLLQDAGRMVIEGFIGGMESKYGAARRSLEAFTSDLGGMQLAEAAQLQRMADTSALTALTVRRPAGVGAGASAATGAAADAAAGGITGPLVNIEEYHEQPGSSPQANAQALAVEVRTRPWT